MDDTVDGKKQDSSHESIHVVVRCRPLSRKEKDEKCDSIVDMDTSIRQVALRHPAGVSHAMHTEGPKTFTFDGVFDESTQQKFFYEEACFQLIESVLEGFNATIFAYGQTGSGKSWTMQGEAANNELRGVMPNAFSHIFEFIKGTKGVQFLIRCSYLEIYNEEIKDLLAPHDKAQNVKYDIRDDPTKGVYVPNLTNVVVETEDQMMSQLEKGLQYRTVAATLMNDTSSRSHSIFTIIIEMNTKDEFGKDHVKAGKLNLVDLAGSERQKKTGATGKTLKEGAKINLSLLTLGCVISALADGKSKHIQYRDSKLTRLLQDSLGGNTKTCMIAAISPAESNYDETLSTLRYANNAKNIKNKPKINEDPKDAMIRAFKEEIERLKQLLMNQTANGLPNMAGINEMMAAAAQANAFVALQNGSSQHKFDRNSQSALHILDDDGTNAIPEDETSALRDSKDKDVPIMLTKDTPSTNSPPELANGVIDALSQEKNQVMEQLKAKENEVEQERRLREQLNQRLMELQNMFVGQSTTNENTNKNGSNENASSQLSPEEMELLAKAEAERAEAERIHKERKLRARKRREQLDKEDLAYVLEEKRAVEDELDELKQSIAASASGEKEKQYDLIEKKVTKVKRKMQKKLQDVQMELDGLKDDFEYQREQLLDAVHDEEVNSSLYMTICKALLNEKDLAKIIERCRYDDNDGEWIIPALKQKSLDLPSAVSRPASSATRKSKGSNKIDNSAAVEMLSSPTSTGLAPLPTLVSQSNNSNNNDNQSKASYTDTSLPPVGMKSSRASPTRQGVASRASESRSNNNNNNANDLASPQGNDQDSKKDAKKKKIKKKVIEGVADEPLPDEAGDGMFAGPLSDWGFAEMPPIGNPNANAANKNAVNQSNNNNASNNSNNNNSSSQYSDDEFEEDDSGNNNSNSNNSPKKKRNKNKSKKQSNNDDGYDNSVNSSTDGSILVPINAKKSMFPPTSTTSKTTSSTPSLPQI